MRKHLKFEIVRSGGVMDFMDAAEVRGLNSAAGDIYWRFLA